MQNPQAVNDVIDHLAAKLSVPTAHLWEVLIRQQRIDVIQCVVFLALFGVGVRVWFRAFWGKKRSDDQLLGMIFSGGFLGILSIIGIIWTFTAVGELLNPEYYALKEILSALR